jgi:hypothetical protein
MSKNITSAAIDNARTNWATPTATAHAGMWSVSADSINATLTNAPAAQFSHHAHDLISCFSVTPQANPPRYAVAGAATAVRYPADEASGPTMVA